MKYMTPQKINKIHFEEVLSTNDENKIAEAIVNSVSSIEDISWLLKQYQNILNNYQSKAIRGVVVTCIGHLARLKKVNDKHKLLNLLETVSDDKRILGQIEDALDDIYMYLLDD